MIRIVNHNMYYLNHQVKPAVARAASASAGRDRGLAVLVSRKRLNIQRSTLNFYPTWSGAHPSAGVRQILAGI